MLVREVGERTELDVTAVGDGLGRVDNVPNSAKILRHFTFTTQVRAAASTAETGK